MSTITKQAVQAVADLKAGYTLGHADVSILNEMVRIALASLDAEPMFYVDGEAAKRLIRGHTRFATITNEPKKGATLPLYTAPPAPLQTKE